MATRRACLRCPAACLSVWPDRWLTRPCARRLPAPPHALTSRCLPVHAVPRLQMRSFLLCGDRQLHDLHSKLRLDHPHGEADQLHK